MLVALLITCVIAGTGYLWLRTSRTQPAQPALVEGPEGPSAVPPADGRLAVVLYLPSEAGLGAAQATIARQEDAQLEAGAAVAAILASDRGAPLLQGEFLLRGFYLDDAGTAYVALAMQGRREARASAREELLAIYSVVNTLTMNFPEVRQVRFLLDGKEAQTLAGHIDLGRSYAKRIDLVRP